MPGEATEACSTPWSSPQISFVPSGEKLGCRYSGLVICAAGSLITQRLVQLVGMLLPVYSHSRTVRGSDGGTRLRRVHTVALRSHRVTSYGQPAARTPVRIVPPSPGSPGRDLHVYLGMGDSVPSYRTNPARRVAVPAVPARYLSDKKLYAGGRGVWHAR